MNNRRILFVSPPLAGHTNQPLAIAEEMVKRGHVVFFATGIEFRERVERIGAKFISWDPLTVVKDPQILKSYKTVWARASIETNTLRGERIMNRLLVDTYEAMFNDFSRILEPLKVDLVVADGFAIAAADQAKKSSTPLVFLSHCLGHLAPTKRNFPQFGTPYSVKMNWKEKICNRIYPFLMMYYLGLTFKKLTRVRRLCGVNESLEDLFGSSPCLVYTTFGVEIPRPIPAHVELIGPVIPKEMPTLPPPLKTWLEEETEDPRVLYVSFGTLVNISEQISSALIDGFAELPFRVLWSLRPHQRSKLSRIPSNVRIESFVPQLAVLAHPAISGILSHCRMNSVSEALYFSKPIIALPFFGDQHYNAARIVDLGAGTKMSSNNLSSQIIKRTIMKTLDNKLHIESLRRISQIQRLSDGRTRAADFIEATLQVGYNHLISPR